MYTYINAQDNGLLRTCAWLGILLLAGYGLAFYSRETLSAFVRADAVSHSSAEAHDGLLQRRPVAADLLYERGPVAMAKLRSGDAPSWKKEV